MSAVLTDADRKLAAGFGDGGLGPVVTGNSHVHPAFAGFLNSVRTAPADALAIQRAAYVSLLQRHDWSFEFSDDHAVYQRGSNALSTLRMLRRELDADGSIWNAHAPEGHKL